MGRAAPVNRKAGKRLSHRSGMRPQKKGRSKGAAKFREETPRKGHGIAIKDRDTALQQYARPPPKSQALIFAKMRKTSTFSDT
jgi:hypothetical protein